MEKFIDISLNKTVHVYSSSNTVVNVNEVYSKMPLYKEKVNSIENELKAFNKEVDEIIVQLLIVQLESININPFSENEDYHSIVCNTTLEKWVCQCKKEIKMRYVNGNKTKNEINGKKRSSEEIWSEWTKIKNVWLKHIDFENQIKLLDTTIKNIDEILIGSKSATEVIFPDADLSMVEKTYKDNAIADLYHQILTDYLEQYIKVLLQIEPQKRLKIIEVGAGTGGTSEMVLKMLRQFEQNVDEYYYTDISQAFLTEAEKKYGGNNKFVRYKKLNIENSPDLQGFTKGINDIVIATNVLHATKKISKTLQNVKVMLRSDGLLLLNELSSNNLFNFVTFGLLDGWWNFEDDDIRIPGSPVLTPQAWTLAMEREGYNNVMPIVEETGKCGQQIIVGKSNGIVTVSHDADVNEKKTKTRKGGITTDTLSLLPTDKIEHYLKASLSEILCTDIEHIDENELFVDIGLNKVGYTKLLNKLKEINYDQIALVDIINNPTVKKLADYMTKEKRNNKEKETNDNEDNIQKAVNNKNEIKYIKNEDDYKINNVHKLNSTNWLYIKIKENVIVRLSEILKIEKEMISENEQFSDYGLDSLTGVILIQKLNEDLSIEMQTTDIFDYSSVKKITQFIENTYKETVYPLLENKFDWEAKKDGNIKKDSEKKRNEINSIDGKLIEKIFDEVNEEPNSKYGSEEKNTNKSDGLKKEPIAIVGMSGRFAKSKNLKEFWKHIADGDNLVEEVIRWDLNECQQNETFCNFGSFLDDYDKFDASFFNISALEATYMDPQQRLFLEECYNALEDAGYAGNAIKEMKCGVYAGCVATGYNNLFSDNAPAQAFWGNACSVLPARIAYFLDLHGPAVAIDTACSSSLTAIHISCQALWMKEVDIAISGGVFVQSTPDFYKLANKAGMLSKTGRCHSFDERADGFVPGEGVGAIIVKRLQDAINDGDHIYGVIKGVGVNQDGTTNGITAPSALSQENLESYVYNEFDVSCENIQLVECHGTGTILGDPIEFNALTKAFRKQTDKKQYCAIGSVKTNIGHAAEAAGVAGVIKILLSLKNNKMPPSINYKIGNKNINFNSSPFYVNTQTKDWLPIDGNNRLAAVSSFGFGGTNVHMVIEDVPNGCNVNYSYKKYHLVVLSAQTMEQLKMSIKNLREALIEGEDFKCVDVSYTLLIGRKHLNNRFACVVENMNELIEVLNTYCETGRASQIYIGEVNNVNRKDSGSIIQFGNECVLKSKSTGDEQERFEMLTAVAELFVQGYELSFELLFTNGEQKRTPLPLYPFKRESYWVDQKKECNIKRFSSDEMDEGRINPLLHLNVSDFEGLKYLTNYNGNEWHIIKSKDTSKRISELVLLEQVRSAIQLSSKKRSQKEWEVCFEKIHWINSIGPITDMVSLQTELIYIEQKKAEFEVNSRSQLQEMNLAQCCRGTVQFNECIEKRNSKYDIDIIRATGVEFKKELCCAMLKECNFNVNINEILIDSMFVSKDETLVEMQIQNGLKEDDTNQNIMLKIYREICYITSLVLMNAGFEPCYYNVASIKELTIKSNIKKPKKIICKYVNESKNDIKLPELTYLVIDENDVPLITIYGMQLIKKENDIKPTILRAVNTDVKISNKNEIPMATSEEDVIASRLKQIISDVTTISVEKIGVKKPFDELGFDSIMISQMNEMISDWIGESDPTVFFKYRNINELVDYYKPIVIMKGLLQKTEKLKPLANKHYSMIEDNKITINNENGENNVSKNEDKKNKQYGFGMYKKHTDEVAIIGLSGRYPKSPSIKTFWKNLYEGNDCITEIPSDRWELEGFYEKDRKKAVKNGLSYSKWGGFLDGIDCFDPTFFGISPKDAYFMDPHERKFLEIAWECIEDSGYTRESLSEMGYGNRIGVFAGITFNNYQLHMAEAFLRANQKMYFANSFIYALANRVSYIMNFTGPSLTIDTACSSSLYSIHLACESIRRGESKMALAGGVNLSIHPSKYITLCTAQIASEDGRCRAFNDGGTGYVPSEGVGAVFLKPLRNAIADGDHVYGIVKGSASSHGGKTSGFTVPNPVSQSLAIETAIELSNIDVKSISCIEAHGTGTSLGDPIEVAGLTDVFKKYTDEKGYCAISSVKSNIGHSEAAAGIAQLTKVLLQMKHGTLVKNLSHSDRPNQNIDFSKTPFKVQEKTEAWIRPMINGVEAPRRAGISSFGAGGSNVHMIIEEYEQKQKNINLAAPGNVPVLIVLSAKNENRVHEKVQQLFEYIDQNEMSSEEFRDLVFTLQVGREAMETRFAIVVDGYSELKKILKDYLSGNRNQKQIYFGNIINDENTNKKNEDEENKIKIDNYIKEWRMGEIADLWCQGIAVNWNTMYTGKEQKRISLPTYPFEKEHYWISDLIETMVEKKPDDKIKEISNDEKSERCNEINPDQNMELLAYEEKWVEKPIENEKKDPGCIVCFMNDVKKVEYIKTKVNEKWSNSKVFQVSSGSKYDKIGQDRYEVNPFNPVDFQTVMKRIKAEGMNVRSILFLWPFEDPKMIVEYGVILYLLQSVINSEMDIQRILLVAESLNNIDQCYIESWLGFSRSLGMVLPNIEVVTVWKKNVNDIKETDKNNFLSQVYDELNVRETKNVKYENHLRYVLRFIPKENVDSEPIYKNNGTYLITGGFGNIGHMLALYLSSKFKANLIITGREVLEKTREEKIDKIERLGGKVFYIQSDVCNFDKMKIGLSKAIELYGDISGIFHLAGTEMSGTIKERNVEQFNRILAPKIMGTITIDELFIGKKLDFICYFSSIAAFLGDFGSCDYAIANRFQLAYSKYRNAKTGTEKYLAVGWPLWRNGGMGVGKKDSTELYLRSSGQCYLEDDDGIQVLKNALAQKLGEILVIKGDRFRIDRILNKYYCGVNNSENKTNKVNYSNQKNILQKESNTGYFEDYLKDIISKILSINVEKLNRNKNLADFGFDSITLTELSAILSECLKIDVSPAVFFNYPTIAKIVELFSKEYSDTLSAMNEEKKANANSGTKDDNVSVCSEMSTVNIYSENKQSVTSNTNKNDDPIVIVGMSGRFPESRNIDEMWKVLKEGKVVVGQPVDKRFENDDPLIEKYMCGWIPGVDEFDAAFFEISPRESIDMDPRQRLLLQESWKALEDAGYGMDIIKEEKIGMYVGVEVGDFQVISGLNAPITSTHIGILAARLSYFLNLNGPNMAINTACSSGLVAVHQACLSLRDGECDSAIAAGVNLLFAKESFNIMKQAGMLSPTGECFPFDERANGLVPGEAIAVVVLKRLSKAIADGNQIYATICGSGINYDGKTNGITSPSGVAQAELLKSIYKKNELNVEDIKHVVTHGTGTKIGDPIEVNALIDVFRSYSHKPAWCALTSSKANFGHTLAASGLISLIGLIQSMNFGIIPPSVNYKNKNTFIKWDNSPFYVNEKASVWAKNSNGKRVGAVSAFGMSGTNCHIVLESYLEEKKINQHYVPYYVMSFSAKSEEALKAIIADYIQFLSKKENCNIDMISLSYTLSNCRHHFKYRYAIAVSNQIELLESLIHIQDQVMRSNIKFNVVSNNFIPHQDIEDTIKEILSNIKLKQIDENRYLTSVLSLCEYYVNGYNVSVKDMFADMSAKKLHVPTYPFVRKKYWPVRNVTNITDRYTGSEEDVLRVQGNVRANGLQPDGKIELRKLSEFTTTGSDEVSPIMLNDENILVGIKNSELGVNEYSAVCENNEIEGFQNDSKDISSSYQLEIDQICDYLAKGLSDIFSLKLDEIKYTSNIIDLGFDSIIGAEWINSINTDIGTKYTSTIIYENETILKLSNQIKLHLEKSNQNTIDVIKAVTKKSKETTVGKQFDSSGAVKQMETQNTIEKELINSLSEVLQMDAKDIVLDDSLDDMGLDSILGVEWINWLNNRFGTNFSASMIYEYKNIEGFKKVIEKNEKDKNENNKNNANSNMSLTELLENVEKGIINVDEADLILQKLL